MVKNSPVKVSKTKFKLLTLPIAMHCSLFLRIELCAQGQKILTPSDLIYKQKTTF